MSDTHNPSTTIGRSMVINSDCMEWLPQEAADTFHAIVTDPPYGLREYEAAEVARLNAGSPGGIWRLPPVLNGTKRSPLPRFTALSKKDRVKIGTFFRNWSLECLRVVRPGGHMFLASNSFLSQEVFAAIVAGGWDFRGELIRLISTLRGGDRPKLHENEFPTVCSFPRGYYEPWGVFRKPLPKKMRVGECLRTWQTGGLRFAKDGTQFKDVIESARAPKAERAISPHPSLKPVKFMRQLVYAALPLGEGIILDPFAGSGTTIAAAELEGLRAVGIERDRGYYTSSLKSIPKLIASKKSE